MGKKNDISGKKYKNLLVLNETKRVKKYLYWKCQCNCGDTCYVTSTDLERGRTGYCPSCNHKKSQTTIINLLYGTYRRGAEKRSLEFTISVEQFYYLTQQNCFYCGYPPKQVFYKKGLKYKLIYNGIDRINNNIGYIIDNCVTACKFCNFAKKCGTSKEYQEWLKFITNKKYE